MKKRRWGASGLTILGLVVVLLTGCGSGNEAGTGVPENGSSGTGSLTESGDRVVVSRSLDFGHVNEKPYAVFSEEDALEVFAKAIKTAKRGEGILDISFPDYDAVIERDGKREEIHLWLNRGSKHGMYTYVSDTGTGYNLTEESTLALVDLIWGIRYGSDQAAANGDVVRALKGLHNVDEWTSFAHSVDAGKTADVQVVVYTIEGDPIFFNLNYTGDMIRLRYDNSHDAFGIPDKRVDFCSSIKAEETEDGTEYALAGCQGEGGERFRLTVPKEQ